MARPQKRKKPKKSSPQKNYGFLIFFTFIGLILLFSLYYDFFYQRGSEKIKFSTPANLHDRKVRTKHESQQAENLHIKKVESHPKPQKPSLPPKVKRSPSPEKVGEGVREARYIPQTKKKRPVPGQKSPIPEPGSPIVKGSPPLRGGRPRVAIIIDDMGLNKRQAQALFKINEDLTFSIIPDRPYSRWTAQEGHKRGYEIMAHIPMEPIDKKFKLGKGGLYLSMPDHQIKEVFIHGINSVPYIVGFNNHMGSAFTQDKKAMGAVFSGINGKKLFFLDSVTTSQSVAASTAKEYGLTTYRRDVFLDAQSDYQFIESQWKRLVKIANKRGQAIAIGHPHKNTILFLNNNLPSQHVNIVPLSEIAAIR